jgi:hypothetical protein
MYSQYVMFSLKLCSWIRHIQTCGCVAPILVVHFFLNTSQLLQVVLMLYLSCLVNSLFLPFTHYIFHHSVISSASWMWHRHLGLYSFPLIYTLVLVCFNNKSTALTHQFVTNMLSRYRDWPKGWKTKESELDSRQEQDILFTSMAHSASYQWVSGALSSGV